MSRKFQYILFETRSRPVAFWTFIFSNNFYTVLTVGAFKENLCCVRCMQASGSIFSFGISAANFLPTVEKCKLNVSASFMGIFIH